jgi:hypothetical protein
MLDDIGYGIVFVYAFCGVLALFILGALGISVIRSLGKLIGLVSDETNDADNDKKV